MNVQLDAKNIVNCDTKQKSRRCFGNITIVSLQGGKPHFGFTSVPTLRCSQYVVNITTM